MHMNGRIILAVFIKQIKDTMKNKSILIQHMVCPMMALIMSKAIVLPDMPECFFVNLFAEMHLGMTALTSMAAIIAEEKEKNTLRILLLSNVKTWEYFIGVGLGVFLLSMMGVLAIGLIGGFAGSGLLEFMGIMGGGLLISMLIGGAIGIWGRSQNATVSITVPATMFFAFLPMIAIFNEKIAEMSQFVYSQQVHNLLSKIGSISTGDIHYSIIMGNVVVAAALFTVAYGRCGLAEK